MKQILITFLLILAPVHSAYAQVELPLEVDELSTIGFLGFGDSITYGVGDGFPIGADVGDIDLIGAPGGYPRRLSGILGIPVLNAGDPGEQLIDVGEERFPTVALNPSVNLVGFMEGANDALYRTSAQDYRTRVQKIINTCIATGRNIILITTPQTCCNHAGSSPIIGSYNAELRDLARVNQLVLADVDFAWTTTCVNKNECELFNIPNGLHPNTTGYDVMAQTILAAMFGVDLFVEGKAAELEEKLGLPAGTIIVKPVPAAPEV